MPNNTTYSPPNIASMIRTALSFNGQGVSITVPHGTNANLDYLMTDDNLMTGAWIVINNGQYGDYIHFQIVDTTGITGHPAGTILNQFITQFYVPSTLSTQLDMLYPAKIIAGLTLRCVYNSTGTSDVFLALNFKFHEVLI